MSRDPGRASLSRDRSVGREYPAGPHLRRSRVRPRARLVAYARRRLGFDTPDAEDLVQDLYVLLPTLMASGNEPIRDIFTYLVVCLQKLAANTRTREQRRAWLLEHPLSVADVDPGPEDGVLARFLIEQVLDCLPPADAELLRCRFLREMRTREIAEHLEITHAAARIRLQRALARARAVVGRSDALLNANVLRADRGRASV